MSVYFLISNQQFWGKVGDILYVDQQKGEAGDKLSFPQVLIHNEVIGTPYVPNIKVECQILKHGKNKKIRVLKFISQKRHRKVRGFRRTYTKLEITKIVT